MTSRRPGFGVALPTSGPFATASNIFAIAEKAEACGYDDVWVNDHLSYPRERLSRSSAGSVEAAGEQDPNFFESLTTLAAVGGRVRRIGLAVHSLVLPLRDPRLFAKQIASIRELAGRQLTVAPGIGSSRDDFAAAGVPFEERGRRLDEYLAVLEVIAKGEHPVAFEGRYVRFGGATLYPRPTNVRLWITGDSEPALRRVVRWGSGWFSSWWPTLAAYEQLGARLDDLAREAGRPPAAIERASDPFVCLAETREAALRICGETLRQRYGSLERALVISAVGSPADVREQLRGLMRSGCTYFELRFICHDMNAYLEMVDRVASDVVPGLRT